MRGGPVSCVHALADLRTPSAYVLTLLFSSHKFIFPSPIFRANFFFLVGELGTHLYGRIVHSHLLCRLVFISPPTRPSIPSTIHSQLPTCAAAPLSHPSIHLYSEHPSSLAHPRIYSLLPPPTHPVYPCKPFTRPALHPPALHPSLIFASIHLPTHSFYLL